MQRIGEEFAYDIHSKIELEKTMVRLAKVVLIDRNFYNFFEWN
jgi:hypothetical protein